MTEDHPTYWYGADKQALLGRLRRIEGQVRGVHRMVEEDTYCIDVLTQISAATKALQAVALGTARGASGALRGRGRPRPATPPRRSRKRPMPSRGW
jgi:hypothetical protein